MNIEQAYIKSEKSEEIINKIKERINSVCDSKGIQLEVGIPNSYDALIANDKKRKVAVSNCIGGWISIIESKEVNDYRMLMDISKILSTQVIAIVLSDVSGLCGYVEFNNGIINDSYFSDSEDSIEECIKNELTKKEIKTPIYMFREIVKHKEWTILSKS